MFSSKSKDIFSLVKSMTKAEKRAFKLKSKSSSPKDKMFIKLFDLIDKSDMPNDGEILKKLKIQGGVNYANLKRHLYKKVLLSLRELNVDKKPNIRIREHIDLAYVLYGRGLYIQALNILELAKKLCFKYETDFSLLTILEFEKLIHSRHITRTEHEYINSIIDQSSQISNSISNRVKLSNLRLKLHQIYVKRGHVKSAEELKELRTFFNHEISGVEYDELSLMEQVYFNQSCVWYYYIIDDFELCFIYAKGWVELFKASEYLQRRDYNLFLRGYHYLLTSAFNQSNEIEHHKYLLELEELRKTKYAKFSENNKIISFLYVHTGRFNDHFLRTDFINGIKIIPNTLRRIERYRSKLDIHKILVIYYKIAWMYIGAGKPDEALSFLLNIISSDRHSLREDIQSYARIMHLMALYDMNRFEMILKVLRNYKAYFEKVKEKNELQIVSLKFFQKLSRTIKSDHSELFKIYLKEISKIRKSKFERRAFLYLNIFHWISMKE